MAISVNSNRHIQLVAEVLYKAMLIFYMVLFGLLFAKAASADDSPDGQLAYANEAELPANSGYLESAIAQVELNALLDRLVVSYEDGRLDEFISLFDKNVKTEDVSGREKLQKQYNELFSMTSSRLFLLHGIEWDKSGSKATGEGDFQVKVKASNGRYITSVHGSFRIEASKQDGQVLITRFVYQPS